MAGVFISYTTRDGIGKDWIIKFRTELEITYKENYGNPGFNIWEMSQSEENFKREIHEALKLTTTIILILSPSYDDSEYTKMERETYIKERESAGFKQFFIKVIKKGRDEDRYKQIVDNGLTLFNFSESDSSEGIITEYKPGSKKYKIEIEKIVRVIRNNEIEHQRQLYSGILLKRLGELNGVPKIYVALGDSKLTVNRGQFIRELYGELNHHDDERLQQTKVLPDDVTTVDARYEGLSELLCEETENDYLKKCLPAIMDQSIAGILHLQTEDESEAKLYVKKIKFQWQAMKDKAQKSGLQLHRLLNIPEGFYSDALSKTSSGLADDIDPPAFAAYRNIRPKKRETIVEFVEEFMKDFVKLVQTPQANEVIAKRSLKQIYLIEYDNPSGAELSEKDLMEEREKRLQLRSLLEKFSITVIPELSIANTPAAKVSLQESVEQRRQYIKDSDGVIVYQGISQDKQWWMNVMKHTHTEILALNKDNYKRVVLVDESQQDKDLIGIYEFKAIKSRSEELNQFLWQIQQA